MENEHLPDIRDANKQPLKLLRTINPAVQLAFNNIRVHILVCDFLAAPMILRTDFCGKRVQAIRPGDKVVELEDRITIAIFCNSLRAQRLLQQKTMGAPYVHVTDTKILSPFIQASATIDIWHKAKPEFLSMQASMVW